MTYDNLSPFQAGVFMQLKKVFARNPGVKVVLLDYIDPAIPSWQTAYAQVLSLFSKPERARVSLLSVHDPKNLSDACDVDPKGHPNTTLHVTWAAQVLAWMTSKDVLQQLGFAAAPHWYDD